MVSQATAAFGTFLQLGDGAAPIENFVTIAEVLDIAGPELGLDTAETTSHDSPGSYEEWVGTILRTGNVSFDVNFLPTDATQSFAAGLILDQANKTLRNFKLIFTDVGATTWSFAALVTLFTPAAPVADKLSASVTLKLSGQPTLA